MKIPKSIKAIDSILNRSALWELIVSIARVNIVVNLLTIAWKAARVGVMLTMVFCFLGQPFAVQAQQSTNDPNYGTLEGILYIGLAALSSIYSTMIVEVSKVGNETDVSNRVYWASQVSTNAWGGIAGINPWPPGSIPIQFPPIIGTPVIIGGTNTLPGFGIWWTTNLGGDWIYLHGYESMTNSEMRTNSYTLSAASTLFFGLFPTNAAPTEIQRAVMPWTQNSGSTTTQRKEIETYDTEKIGLPVRWIYALPPDRNAAQRATEVLRKAQASRKNGG